MHNNLYMPYSQQNNIDRINTQISELEKLKQQMQQQTPAINQTFQIAPSNSGIRYANTIDDVNKEQVFIDTPFFSKDMSIVWIKNAKGNIKSYELIEIIPKDEKDIQIEYLQSQIEELRGMIKNDANVTNVNAKQDATDTTKYDESVRTTTQEDKSTSIQKIPRSKKEQ